MIISGLRIEICGLNVTFGSAGETISKWGWRSGGKKGVWTKEGDDTSETEWLKLNKIQTTA